MVSPRSSRVSTRAASASGRLVVRSPVTVPSTIQPSSLPTAPRAAWGRWVSHCVTLNPVTDFASNGLSLDATAPKELHLLRAAFAVERPADGSCMCLGDLTFRFAGRDGREVASVGFHLPGSLRWTGWDGDVLLHDGTRVLSWLARHDVQGPPWDRRPQAERDAEQRARDQWVAAAPAAVRDLLDLALATPRLPAGVHDLVARRLAAAFPDPADRAVALLRWYGAGSGRVTDRPAYEGLPEVALAALPVADLARARQANDAQVEAGAVRYLSGPGQAPTRERA